MKYLEQIKMSHPKGFYQWHGNILAGKLIWEGLEIEYSIDFSEIDFFNVDSYSKEIQNARMVYKYNLDNLSDEERNKIEEILPIFIPFFEPLAKKEMEVCQQ